VKCVSESRRLGDLQNAVLVGVGQSFNAGEFPLAANDPFKKIERCYLFTLLEKLHGVPHLVFKFL
jgi:hypothetical protein